MSSVIDQYASRISELEAENARLRKLLERMRKRRGLSSALRAGRWLGRLMVGEDLKDAVENGIRRARDGEISDQDISRLVSASASYWLRARILPALLIFFGSCVGGGLLVWQNLEIRQQTEVALSSRTDARVAEWLDRMQFVSMPASFKGYAQVFGHPDSGDPSSARYTLQIHHTTDFRGDALLSALKEMEVKFLAGPTRVNEHPPIDFYKVAESEVARATGMLRACTLWISKSVSKRAGAQRIADTPSR